MNRRINNFQFANRRGGGSSGAIKMRKPIVCENVQIAPIPAIFSEKKQQNRKRRCVCVQQAPNNGDVHFQGKGCTFVSCCWVVVVVVHLSLTLISRCECVGAPPCVASCFPFNGNNWHRCVFSLFGHLNSLFLYSVGCARLLRSASAASLIIHRLANRLIFIGRPFIFSRRLTREVTRKGKPLDKYRLNQS